MSKELTVKSPTSLAEKQEDTRPVRTFVPNVDIRETDEALWLWADMPGAAEDSIDVRLDNGELSIRGKVSVDAYKELTAVYTEYNIGHYRRSFSLSNTIDQSKITAEMKDGVLTLTLPKAEEAKPRKISIT